MPGLHSPDLFIFYCCVNVVGTCILNFTCVIVLMAQWFT